MKFAAGTHPAAAAPQPATKGTPSGLYSGKMIPFKIKRKEVNTMITTVGEIKNRTENEIEIIQMFLNADAEQRKIITHVLKRLAEDPNCLNFTKDWKGTATELRAALAQI